MTSLCLPSHMPLQEFLFMYQDCLLVSVPCFSGLVDSPNRLAMAGMCTLWIKMNLELMPGSIWLSWACGYVPILIPNTPRQKLFFWRMFMTALGISSPVQDYLTGSVSWGCSRVLNLYLVRYSFLHPQV